MRRKSELKQYKTTEKCVNAKNSEYWELDEMQINADRSISHRCSYCKKFHIV